MTMLLLPLTFTSLSPSPLIIDNHNCLLFSPGDCFSIFNNLATLAEIFHLQKLFLKGQCIDLNISAALLCGHQSKGKPYTRAPQTKIHAFKWKKIAHLLLYLRQEPGKETFWRRQESMSTPSRLQKRTLKTGY